ncbi:AAA family ATPase [Acinetobacter baylyi]|uniref:AAA family ATPase n=1 Tax=Acinetobacter baylyi TaxID=202950 RepID=UPI000EA29D0F|nr:AAA family ATPase [Acinetobacter baylyi]
MKISNIHIENFRGLKQINLNPAQMNCVIGENNAGKSSILLALKLFLNGSRVNINDYYDLTKPIIIEVSFNSITDNDLLKIVDAEHRIRIRNLIQSNEIKFQRKYDSTLSSELLCYKKVPKNEIYTENWYNENLKGKTGSALKDFMKLTYSLSDEQVSDLRTQAIAKEQIEQIASALDEEDLHYIWSSLPTGINVVSPIFPEPIYIPAVKDFSDDTKTKETTSFGKLVKILFSQIEASEEFNEIQTAFENLNKMLNRQLVTNNNSETIIDNRLESVKQLELDIERVLQESFSNIKLELQIPNPELKQIFNSTQILIDDGIKSTIDYKGDGIKRSLVFSILRTYVERLNISNNNPDYLFLFEEPELYLHPNGQRILYSVLEKLSNKDQVFVTTHSPNFFSATAKETCFIKIYKDSLSSPPYSKAKEINFVQNSSYKDAFQIICYENTTPAFFSNKVLLVEGDSDLIFLKGLSPLINSSYCFDKLNIPIIRINGKNNIKRFVNFYQHFDIKVFSLLDRDVLLDGFTHLELGNFKDEVMQLREAFITKVDAICGEENIVPQLKSSDIKNQRDSRSWVEKYYRLKDLTLKFEDQKSLTNDEFNEIRSLFEFETNHVRRIALDLEVTNHLPEKINLINRLYELGYFVLNNGAIENYYPSGYTGADKPSKALNALEILKTRNLNYLPKISYLGNEDCELSRMMHKIFS